MDDSTAPDPTQVSPTPSAAVPPSPGPEPLAAAAPPPAVPPPTSPTPPPTSPAPPAAAAPPPSWGTPRRRTDEGRWVGVIFGLILLGVGLWFFAERTLGLTMPDISWNQFWPVILIAIGVVILFNGIRRDRH